MKKLIPVLFICLLVVTFFWQFLVKGLLPIPSDTIIGLYHPFRDLYAKNYPNGIPFKNFLITDPVRQQYPWRELVISVGKKLELPLWNPYNFAGTPLLANFQSAPFYVFNILFFIMPFVTAWSLIIFLGPLLGGIFLFFYLNNLNLNKWASITGSISFSFSGFFVAWMEWGTITHVGLWLPLILLAIDKVVSSIKYQVLSIKNKKLLAWSFVYLFSLTSSFFAGHLQTFFYLGLFSFIYFIARWWQYGKKIKILVLYIILNTLFLILTTVQWIPTLQFVLLSARNIDQVSIDNLGWFIPWQHLIQFVAPDFFGNPTTLNYWGVWNYGEFIGYVGLTPLIFALFSLLFRRDKKTLFFGIVLFISLIFSLPTFFAKIPFVLHIPFLETAQPTRLLFLVDFSLSILAALGFDYYLKYRKKIFIPLVIVGLIFTSLWGFTFLGYGLDSANLSVAESNLKLPTGIFVFSSAVLLLGNFIKKGKYTIAIAIIIVTITFFDLFRFGLKFNPFTSKNYLFPQTQVISFLQKNIGEFRIMSEDSRILPPNFSVIYRLQSVDGYDPLYLRRYGELIAASERKKADINPPFGFNRIITPHNYDSKITDLLGVKFILSLSDLKSDKLKKVFQEEETRVYENKNVLPRTFFAQELKFIDHNKAAIKTMFEESFDLNSMVVVEGADRDLRDIREIRAGMTDIVYYSENKVIIETENSETGFLVLTDSFYPTWKVKIDSRREDIYRTDYNFRGVIVPAGKHKIEFYNSLF